MSSSTTRIKGREVNFGFFFVFFWNFFRFLGFPCVFVLFLVFSFHFARFSCEFWRFLHLCPLFPCSSMCFLFFFFCFVVLFLEEVWRWEESSLNIKKLEGGWGGGGGAPPDALGVVAFVRVACLVLFFRFFLVLMFFVSSCCSWKRCSGERSHP